MPETLPYTDDEDANRLLANDPFALLVGLVLYQQVPIEKAFMGPQVLKDRLGGTLDAKTVTATDPEELETIFRERPAIHRFRPTWRNASRASLPTSIRSIRATRRCCGQTSILPRI